MKSFLITSDCFHKGEFLKKGLILKDVDNASASQLLTSGRAVPFKGAVAVKAEEKPEVIPAKKAAKKVSKKAAKKVAKKKSAK